MDSPKDISSLIVDIENVIESQPHDDIISQQVESVFMHKFSNEFRGEASSNTDITRLSNLPDTILLKIFSNFSLPELCHIALVCKHWLWVVYDSELWKYVDLSGYSKITEKHIISLINARLSPLLKTLDLSNREITPVIINELNDNCQQLDTLVLQNCDFSSSASSSDHEIKLKSTVPDKLVRLDIRNFKRGFHFIHLILEASDLSHIECFGFGNNHFCPAFSDFQLVFRRMHSLRILECVNCETFNDGQLKIIADELNCLESLVLKKCENIKGSTLQYLIQHAKKLKSLNLAETKVTDTALVATTWEDSHLEEFDLSFCLELSSVGLLGSIPRIQTLQYLALHNVGKSKAVTTELLERVHESQSWNKLEVLCLRFCNQIASESLLCMQNCLNLKYISFRTCYKIGYASIASSLKYFPNLMSLECGSLRISDESICTQWIEIFAKATEHCPNLRSLALVKCSGMPVSKVSAYRKIMCKFLLSCKHMDTICVLYSEEAILSLFKEAINMLPSNRDAINLSSVPVPRMIPPFRHSLDTELNHRRFRTFSF